MCITVLVLLLTLLLCCVVITFRCRVVLIMFFLILLLSVIDRSANTLKYTLIYGTKGISVCFGHGVMQFTRQLLNNVRH